MPRTGNAYGGFIAYGFGTNYKEYIQSPLLNTLEKDKYYTIEYYVCLGNFASVACNNLGLCFSQSNSYQNNTNTLNYPNALFSTKIISDTLNWSKITFNYKANGTENYLIIGNFKNDINTDTILSFAGGNDVYYCIDDISITQIDLILPNVFTPNGDGHNDIFYFNSEIIKPNSLTIYNRWGNRIFDSKNNFAWDGRTTSGVSCNAGIYYYIIQTEAETYKGFLDLIK